MKTLITTRTINTLKPKDRPFEIRDTQLKGLILRVQPTGVMVYYLEYERGKRVKVGRADVLTPAQAREDAKKVLSEALRGEDPANKKRLLKTKTFLQFLGDDYLPWLTSNIRTGQATHDRLKASFPEFHSLRLHEITPWLAEKWKQRRHKDKVTPSTINRELADLRACLKRAVDWGIIEKHPLEGFKRCKVEHNGKVRYLTKEEEKKLRAVLDDREFKIRLKRKQANQWRSEREYVLYPDLTETAFADYLKPVVLLSINTGLRRGELFGLRWQDVNFPQKILTVVASNAKSGKTRHVPLNDEAMAVLKGWQAQSPEGLIFQGKDGEAFHDVRKSWAAVLKTAKINDFRWHDLRHHFASRLVMAGVDLNTVRELLGHSDYKMTLRYAHLAPEHKAAAVAKLMNA